MLTINLLLGVHAPLDEPVVDAQLAELVHDDRVGRALVALSARQSCAGRGLAVCWPPVCCVLELMAACLLCVV